MSRFHLMHCVPPDPRLHGLNGYLEVIQTIAWGLQQLGHEAGYSLNRYDPDAVNVIFGAQMLPLEFLERLPETTVVYNMEQLRNAPLDDLRAQIRVVAQRFRIWDYSSANLEVWKQLGGQRVAEVPVGYAPVLTRIPKPAEQDVDVLIYGLSSPQRLESFHRLSSAGLVVVFLSGLYGRARDELISRSKMVLNATLYERAHVFEVVRASYLLANRKAVVSLRDERLHVEPDIAAGIRFTTFEQLVPDCLELMARPELRQSLEAKGFEVMSQRDIRAILRRVLAQTDQLGQRAAGV